MSKNIFAQSSGLQPSNLAETRFEVAKPERGESIDAELGNNHGAAADPAAAMHAAVFDAIAPVAEGQSSASESDKILPSAASFHDASVDPLHSGLIPLALLGPEGQRGSAFAVTSVTPHLNVAAAPTITIPPPGGPATTVFEAGLGPRTGEPPGTHAGQPAFPITTRTGTISFTSDEVQSVSLGGHLLTNTPQTFADGTTGTLTASYSFNATTGKGTITYSYTLLDNTLGVPSASFAVVVTDRDGDSNPPANLVIRIMDDAPVARADTDTLSPGQTTADGNVLTGAGTTSGVADMQGADGGVTVVGVAAGNGPGGAAPGTVGAVIAGAHGNLTLNADGSYSYVATSGGGNDVFTYTTRDADGSLAHATLTINLGDAAPGNIVIPPPNTPGQTLVFEAGLAARGVEPPGSHAGDPSTPVTASGTITFTSPDGVSKIELGGLLLTAANPSGSFTDATGRLTASYTIDPTGAGRITYTYSLLDNTLGIPNVSFTVAVTDADGDRTVAASNLVINIVDDAPTAVADADAVVAGQLTAEIGNVLTGAGTTSGAASADIQGADGAAVAGVAVGNTGTDLVNVGTVGAAIAGALGTLTLNADGSYSYAHTGAPGGGIDTFTYTIRDADGSLSHATLTIAVADSTPGTIAIPPGNTPGQTQVFEAGLSARGAEPAGSHAGSASFPTTSSGTITFTSPDGVQKIELGGLVLTITGTPQTFTDATGSLTASFTYDPTTGRGIISYSYTLLDNTVGVPSVSFAVAVTDADGDRTSGGNLIISIVDDAPVAVADTDSVAAGQLTTETGNVISGVGTTSGAADVQGADAAVVAGVAAGITGVDLVNAGTVGVAIAGAFGTLTLNAEGSYSYAHTGAPGGGTDVFTYTIRDADGSLSHATLTIAVADSSPGNIVIPPGNTPGQTQVFEAGLGPRGVEPAGSHSGDPSFPATTAGTIAFTSPDGVQKIELGGLVLTVSGAPQTFSDATGSLTASFTYDPATGRGTISYSYTLLDNTVGTPSVSFAVAVTDADGDRTSGGSLTISIVDDAPVAAADTDAVVSGQTTAETGNVISGVGTTSGSADVQGADGAVVAGVAVGNTGVDLVNAGTVGAAIAGAFGTLTLNADGSYSYAHTGAGGGTEVFTYTMRDADGSLSHATLTIAVADSTPGNIVIPPSNTPGQTQVFEAGLPARGVEPAGSHTGDPSFPASTSGTITFTSPDGVSKIELGRLTLTVSGTPQTFTDATGSLTASYSFNPATGQGTISYSYTLLDNTLGTPSASFAVAVTDADGDRVQGGDLTISIVDDAPVAVADTDAVAAGQTTAETGNVLTGAGTTSGAADLLGADGAAAGGAVVGVALGTIATPVSGGVGLAIAGAFGTLTLNADGSYSYAHNGTPGGGIDVFTYTIRDADGSQSTATLTLTVADSSPGGIEVPGPDRGETTVFEAGLPARTVGGVTEPAGSNPAAPTTTDTGSITFTSPDGVSKIELGRLVLTTPGVQQTFTDATGTLTALFTYDTATGLGEITYSYTLLDNTLGIPTVSFAVAVTDLDGDRSSGGDLVIGIIDDAPFALSDTDAIVAGQTTSETGNVLTGVGTASGDSGADIEGADGAVVAGVAVGNTGVDLVDPTTVNAPIQGAFGKLTLHADGSYTYERTGGAGTDIFTYTMKDGDGSLSSTTLTIAIGDSVPTNVVIPPPGGAATQVFEAGLPARGGEPAGSDSTKPTTTQTGTITFTSPDGVLSVMLGGHALSTTAQTFADGTRGSLTAFYTFDPATGRGTITYSYALLDNTLGTPTVDFAVVVTDPDGDSSSPVNLTINIVDDAPLAKADIDAVASGQTGPETGNVITGAGTTSAGAGDDVQGADGAGVAGVARGNTGADLVNAGTVGAGIRGDFGTLTLNADGSYSYVRNIGVPGGNHTDTFTYTLRDADGSLSHATLTINVANSSPGGIDVPGPDRGETTVFEAGLPARTIGGVTEPAGSNPGASTVTDTGTIGFTSLDGVSKIELGRLVLTTPGAQQTFTDATGTLTASFTYDAATGLGEITYRYTLLDNTLGNPLVNNGDTSVKFGVAVTDADGDRMQGDDLVIGIIDDAPFALSDTDAVAANQTIPETGNVLTGFGTMSGDSGIDILGADGAVIAGVAAGNTGIDLVNAGTVGAAIVGAFGTLTLNADGSYSYGRTGGSGTDIFTYTIRDADGDLSSTTLSIAIGGSVPTNIVVPPPGGPDTQVFEAGLPARGGEPAGSHAGDPAFPKSTTVGTITFTSPDGVAAVFLGGHTLSAVPQTFTDATGSLTASLRFNAVTGQGEIFYSYTLLDNTLGSSSVNLPVVVIDPDGDSSSPVNLTINIVDDASVARADTDTVLASQTTAETGNVITGAGTTSGAAGLDISGADGGLAVTGVAKGDTGVDLVDTGTVGIGIHGQFGTLAVNADGSYSYVRDAGGQGGVTDTFTYTIKDADGSRSHTTLKIALADSAPSNIVIPTGGTTNTVFEAGLPARASINEPPGSHAGDPSFPTVTQIGAITFTSLDGLIAVRLGDLTIAPGLPSFIQDDAGRLNASVTFDAATGQGTINYRYTLFDNTDQLETPSAVFAVTVIDGDFDRTTGGDLTITIVDDAPVAKADSIFAPDLDVIFANLITGEGTEIGTTNADIPSADGGVALVGVELGDTGRDFVDPNPSEFFFTPFGVYQFSDDGSVAFGRDISAPDGGTEILTYTLRDADGSLSHATLRTHLGAIGNLAANIASARDNTPNDMLTDGSSARQFLFNAPGDGGAHILDFKHGTDSIDVLLAGFTGLSGKGAVAGTDFVTSDNASSIDLGAARFAYNASNGELFYDSNGSDASGASRILLAFFENHAALAATDIHKI